MGARHKIHELEQKIGKLMAFCAQERNKQNSKAKEIIF